MSQENQIKQYQQSSYGGVPQPGNPTYSEAWALVEAARRLAIPITRGDVSQDEALRDEARTALRLNWRLWTIFQTELSVEDNETVPNDIRGNMLSLCNFVDKQTVDCIGEPTTEKISALIDINRNIAQGLLESLNTAIDATEQTNTSDDDAGQEQPQQPFSIDTDI